MCSAVVVVGRLRGGFGEEAVAEVSCQGADGGGTGDDDTDVGFDCGPVAYREVIPSHVVGVGELDEEFEAEDADDGDAVELMR